MSLLTKVRSEDPSVKSLVISQFTSMLNIVETPLKAEGFSFVRLDGTMSQRKRAEVIEMFDDRGPDSPTVMLLSLKAGGVGLNLTAASRVFLLDPVCHNNLFTLPLLVDGKKVLTIIVSMYRIMTVMDVYTSRNWPILHVL